MHDEAAGMAGPVEFETTGDTRRGDTRRGDTRRAETDASVWADTDHDDAIAANARTDPAAFRVLYERHWPSVYRYLRARTGRDDDAADLAATTFERALAGVRGYRPGSAGFRAWLARIARNTAIDASRRRRPTEPIEAIERIALAEPGPEAFALDAERSRELRALVAALPDAQRDAVILRYAAGLNAREIGSVIGKSEAATQKLLTRALARLKESYRDQE
jgi:RNA polymerase sigma-70 factor (ECF subfamily)